jgi:hypothetical protein
MRLRPFKALLQFNHSSYLSLAKMLRFYEIHPAFFAIPKLSTLRRPQLRGIKNPHALPNGRDKHNAELNTPHVLDGHNASDTARTFCIRKSKYMATLTSTLVPQV